MTSRFQHYPLLHIALMSLPVGIVYTLAWFGVFTFVNNYLKHNLGYSPEDWTAVTLWYTGSMVVWPFLCNEVSSWLGRRLTITLAMVLAGLLFYGFSIFHQRFAICIFLSLTALSVTVVSTVFLPMVAEAGGDKPGRALVTFNFVNNLIGAAALIGGSVLATRFGYERSFFIFAFGCGISAVFFHLITANLGNTRPAKIVSVRNLSRADILSLVTGSYLVLVLCGLSMEAFNYHTVNQLWPNLAREQFHMSDRTITTIVALGRLPALLTLTLLGQFVDRINIVRFYGFSFLFVAICVFTLGTVHTDATLQMVYVAYFLGMGCIWGSNSPAVNASVAPRLRDSAFAVMMVPSLLAVFLVGIIHNRLLAAHFTLPQVFHVCGLIGITCGGLVLIVYSFTRHARQGGMAVTNPPLPEQAIP